MAPAQNGKQRISILMAVLLIGAAFIVDALQALLELIGLAAAPTGIGAFATLGLSIAGVFLGVAADIVFLIWLKLLGVDYTGKNALAKLGTIGAMTAITLIPGLDLLPELTCGIAILVIQTRMEDAAQNPGTARAVGTAARVVGTVVPEAQLATRIVRMEAARKERQAEAEQERLERAANDNHAEEEQVA